MSLAHEADWIRYAGVTIAFAGAFMAAPDGVAEVWRHVRGAARQVRVTLARYLPFLRKSANVMGTAAEAAVAAGAGSVVKRRTWEPDASDSQKTEILHHQVDFLIEEVDNFKTDVTRRFAVGQRELWQAEARLSVAHSELARQVEASDRRAAQIDARGLWPIAFGILLTGIPGELSDVAAVGLLVTAAAAAGTVLLGVAVIKSRRREQAGHAR